MLYQLSYLGTNREAIFTSYRPLASTRRSDRHKLFRDDYNTAVLSLIARWVAALVLLSALAATPVVAWTPKSQQAIAEHAARFAPPDLYRQLARNRVAFLQGVRDGFGERDPAAHAKNPNGSGRLDNAIEVAVDNAIGAIVSHQPFQEISYRLGIVSHFVADANNPLNADENDREEGRYYADFLNYLEFTEPRIRIVFYGFRPGFDGKDDLTELIDEALDRGRGFYPAVGREYRRVRFTRGVEAFDDLSSAFGVASLAYSHAISDIAEVLRYIWLESGGIDTRRRIPLRGKEVIRLPRAPAR